MLYLPRLFVYHCEAEAGSKQSETFKVMERRDQVCFKQGEQHNTRRFLDPRRLSRRADVPWNAASPIVN
jgi:hypothetical protein